VTRGRFITFEGGEGAGKSTQVRRLAERLSALPGGRGEVVTTREPGGSPGAEAIRALLVSGPVERWSPITETLLMYAARRDHIERVIAPALERGAWVICDRFYDSTRAYQGAAGGAPRALIHALEAEVVGAVIPDLTLVLDLPIEAGLARATRRGDGEGRFEAKGRVFHQRLREAFLDIAAQEPERCRVIDARGTIAQIAARIDAAVAARWDAAAHG
jgi:dTMP kinase